MTNPLNALRAGFCALALLAAPLAASLLALLPASAHAGSQFFPGAGASGPNVNLNNTYENQAFGTNGGTGGKQLTAGTVNAKGTCISLGTIANDWRGFYVMFYNPANSSDRFLTDVSTASDCSSPLIQNLYANPGNISNGFTIYEIPLAVASGSTIYARTQSAVASRTVWIALTGIVKNASSPPVFTVCDQLDTSGNATTFISTTDVTVSADPGTFSTVLDPTTQAYGALIVQMGVSGTAALTNQIAEAMISVTATGGTPTKDFSYLLAISATTTQGAIRPRLFYQTIASNSKIAAAWTAATNGTDKLRFGVWGCR